MKILIYGINYSPELVGIGKYSGEMSAWLAAKGHDVRVVTAPPYYPEWRVAEGHNNAYSRSHEGDVRVIRCPLFVPSKPSTLSRFLHLFSFSASSAFPVLGSCFWKPDIVIQVVPTLFCSLQTLLLSWLTGAKAIIHIQDYEVDAMFKLSMASGGFAKRIAYWAERKILNRFDIVSTISEGMMKRAAEKGLDAKKLVFFPNWSEVARFSNVQPCPALLEELGVDTRRRIILYSGNMGEKQGLDIVIHVAKRMESKTDIHFLMVGEGSAKAELEHLASTLSLTNITFFPLQPYAKLPELLASAACHLVIQKSGAADAVMPSKLTNILAVGGNSVITATKDTSLGSLCCEYNGLATLVEPESISALQDGILAALAMPMPNPVAKQYAQDYLDKDVILNRFITEITREEISKQPSSSSL
jgi:colanic acid biosynthesis glycosyl transferase WcaI